MSSNLSRTYWLPALLWMGIIFLFSSDLFAASHTGSVFELLVRSVWPSINESTLKTLHFGFRKCAHIFSYGLLAFFYSVGLTKNFSFRKKDQFGIMVKSFLGAVLYAGLDEWHQSFSAVRTGTILDVGWDALGACIFQLWMFFAGKK